MYLINSIHMQARYLGKVYYALGLLVFPVALVVTVVAVVGG